MPFAPSCGCESHASVISAGLAKLLVDLPTKILSIAQGTKSASGSSGAAPEASPRRRSHAAAGRTETVGKLRKNGAKPEERY